MDLFWCLGLISGTSITLRAQELNFSFDNLVQWPTFVGVVWNLPQEFKTKLFCKQQLICPPRFFTWLGFLAWWCVYFVCSSPANKVVGGLIEQVVRWRKNFEINLKRFWGQFWNRLFCFLRLTWNERHCHQSTWHFVQALEKDFLLLLRQSVAGV